MAQLLTLDTLFFLGSVALGLVSFTLLFRWYWTPWLEARRVREGWSMLLLLHSFRTVGLAFMVPGVVSPELHEGWRTMGALGDLAAALLAFAGLWAVRRGSAAMVPLLWTFSVVGMADFVNNFVEAPLLGIQPANLGATWFIPTMVVPPLIVSHLVMIRWLRTGRVPRPAG